MIAVRSMHTVEVHARDPMITAICLFLLGACAGLFMVFRHIKKLRLPGWAAIAHGLAGAAGFAVLLLFCLREPAVVPARYALGILIGAIALGCINVVYHLRGVRHRLALILAHALVAVSGVGTLAYAAFVHPQRPSIDPLPPVPEPVPTSAPAPIAQETQQAPALGPAWSDLRVRFDSNRDHPTSSSETSLASIAQALIDDQSIELVEVQGHADERGTELTNLELTRARARAVVNALMTRGVAPSRLRSAAYGSRCPARSECRDFDPPPACHDDDALSEDRRVTFVVVESGGRHFVGPMACDLNGGS
jgi:outer membrane protein OmpA-like peptidoglycan-associated protein